MLHVSCVLVALCCSLVSGRIVPRTLQVHEARESVPNGYQLTGPASPDTVLSLRIAITSNDTDGLIDVLYDISTPSSANYGKYLTKAEAEAYAAPNPDSVAAVNAWLSENGLESTTLSPAGDWIGIQVPVSKANDMLNASFSVFTYPKTGLTTVRTLSYSIPSDLKGHLDLVHPTISFPDPNARTPPVTRVLGGPSTETSSSSPCADVNDNGMTPACLQYLYGIPTTPATVSTNRLAVTEYEDEYFNQTDLQTFLQTFRPDMNSSTTLSIFSIDGGLNLQNETGLEAALDTEYTVGLATNVPAVFITVGGEDFQQALLDTATALLAEDSPPQVVSTSYGEDEDLLAPAFAQKLCNTYAQLGARGVSLIFSSGDGGVSGNQESQCRVFVPVFPSACPYITSVGATTQIPEVAVDFSGGGFSNYFLRPVYQETAVTDYLLYIGTNMSGLYNAVGRGYPDVSAYGVDFEVVAYDFTFGVSGTSCSAPTWASIIALLNDRLLAAGKPVLGFLNPWLYSTGASALTDIVYGNNDACGPYYNIGFDATTGWDPVTGLGTPKFASLLSSVGL
ncbi:family S53 protease [Wolfiporia cocos MD-104 SS10]|uniref:tripeptidyl-peptidase II n=1 Tax=Wolfiporia cocos (strain MD-104) TaxID=742152 RepID=A0A2H3JGR9_WOLCO|nr:family S53 protease [Wolfiporia cocos MD-104 SS10]